MSKVITTIRNAWRIKDLRSKILFTLFILVIYRLGAQIPVPFINTDQLDVLNASASTGLLQYLNIFSGEAFSRATLFALSISPYITSSIVNVEALNAFEDGAVVDLEALTEKGIIRKEYDGLKVLGRGEITKKLTVKAKIFSASAK